MDCGAPFHPTWKKEYHPEVASTFKKGMNSYTFIQDGGKNNKKKTIRKSKYNKNNQNGGLSLYSSNMDCGAPFHPTWKKGYLPPNNSTSRPNMNNYTFIQEGGMDSNMKEGYDNPINYPMEPEHFFNQPEVITYLSNNENQLLEQLKDKDPEEDFINIVDDYLEQNDRHLPKRQYIQPDETDEKTEVDSGDRNYILSEMRHEYIYDVLHPYLEKKH